MTFEASNSYGIPSYDENSESSWMHALDESPRRRRRGINLINPNYDNQSVEDFSNRLLAHATNENP
jgi:hypothetical protein